MLGATMVVPQGLLECLTLLRVENIGDLRVGAVHDRHHLRVNVAPQLHRFFMAALKDRIDRPLLIGGEIELAMQPAGDQTATRSRRFARVEKVPVVIDVHAERADGDAGDEQ